MTSNTIACLHCNDGQKLTAENPTCDACGRIWSEKGSLFETSIESLSESMDEAFEGIVREPTKTSADESSLGWWYVENGRRVGPVSLDRLRAAVHALPEPTNVLIWNEGFTTWRRFGEVEQLQSGNEPSTVVVAEDPEEPPSVREDDDDIGTVGVSVELPEIGEDMLAPEGEPLTDWKPQAASSLRDLSPLEQSPIEAEGWEDDDDDIGLPPSVDTAEFKRDELSAHENRAKGSSPMLVVGVAAALIIGAFIVGKQFWAVSGVDNASVVSTDTTPGGTPTIDSPSPTAKPSEALEITPPLPPTSIQATTPIESAKAEKQKPVPKKRRKAKKAKKLPNTVSDQVLAKLLKKNSVSLAPCIEGAVVAKELPAGRHVIRLAYDILPNGRVSSASLVGPAYLQGGALSRCVESTLSGWRYPKTAKGREVRGQELAFRARAP